MASSHRVAAPGHAYAKRLIEVAAPLVQRVLLLLHIGTLLKLLLFRPSTSPHASEQCPRGGANGCSFSGVSSYGTTDGSQSGSTGGAAEQSAPPSAHCRRRAAGNLGIRGIEPALLNCPRVALAPIILLLLRTLTPAWIDIRLAGATVGRSTFIAFALIEASSLVESTATEAFSAKTASKYSATPSEYFRSNRQNSHKHQDGDTRFDCPNGPIVGGSFHESSSLSLPIFMRPFFVLRGLIPAGPGADTVY